jgi:D-amino-acid dehydrogenase
MTLSWSGGKVRAKTIILAAGVKSAALARQLGYKIPMVAERGYHMHYRLKPGAVLNRPVYDTGGAFVLSPMQLAEGPFVRVLSGVEIARAGDRPTPLQLNKILPDALKTLDLTTPLENEPWCGNRPSMPDGIPVIGLAKRHPNLIFAFGHGHIGLSTGPITGRIVADLLTGATPPFDLAPYRAERFRGGR